LSWEGQVPNLRKNGQQYPARAVVSPVRGVGRKIGGFIAVFTDILNRSARSRSCAKPRSWPKQLITPKAVSGDDEP